MDYEEIFNSIGYSVVYFLVDFVISQIDCFLIWLYLMQGAYPRFSKGGFEFLISFHLFWIYFWIIKSGFSKKGVLTFKTLLNTPLIWWTSAIVLFYVFQAIYKILTTSRVGSGVNNMIVLKKGVYVT